MEHTERDHHHSAGSDVDAELVELLDLDGEVLAAYWAEAIGAVGAVTAGQPARVVDLGAGSGVGTLALAHRFDAAEIVAVDVSAAMLQRIEVKARTFGVAARVQTRAADLDAGWPPVSLIDLAWASMSMHHFADPDRVLRDVFAATRPGGVVAVVEMSGHLRFLPSDLGVGLEARCLDMLGRRQAELLPHLGSEWTPRIEAAGFAVIEERAFIIDEDRPNERAAARYARLWLGRLRAGLEDDLDPDDRSALASLLDGDGPDSLAQLATLHLRGVRTLTLGRRIA